MTTTIRDFNSKNRKKANSRLRQLKDSFMEKMEKTELFFDRRPYLRNDVFQLTLIDNKDYSIYYTVRWLMAEDVVIVNTKVHKGLPPLKENGEYRLTLTEEEQIKLKDHLQEIVFEYQLN